jgi:nucleotide-binding universal stress UspA family protein
VFGTVIWATDGSEAARRALPYARALADRLVVVHVRERLVRLHRGQPTYADEGAVEARIRGLVEQLRDEGVDVTLTFVTTLDANAAHALADAAEAVDAGLIVVGTRGRRPLVGTILGNVTQRLRTSRVAPCWPSRPR